MILLKLLMTSTCVSFVLPQSNFTTTRVLLTAYVSDVTSHTTSTKSIVSYTSNFSLAVQTAPSTTLPKKTNISPVQTTLSTSSLYKKNESQTSSSNILQQSKTTRTQSTTSDAKSETQQSITPKQSPSGSPPQSSSSIIPDDECENVDGVVCKNGGICKQRNSSQKKMTPVCFCFGGYYGDRCQLSVDKDDRRWRLYKQLSYALAGTTAFLLIVIACMIGCRNRENRKRSASLNYSKELDDFTIANKRASAVIKNPNVLHAFDMYSNGSAEKGDTY